MIFVANVGFITKVYASELDEYSVDDVQKFLNDNYEYQDIDFRGMVSELIKGDSKNVFRDMAGKVVHNIWMEIIGNKKAVLKIIIIAVISAIFSGFANALSDRQIDETGFYVTYIVITTILIGGFELIVLVAENMVKLVLGYVEVLLPSYILAIGTSVGTATGAGYYETMLISLMAIEYIFLKLILPGIRVYVVILLLNNILKEDMLSKTADIIRILIKWGSKFLIGFVTGINLLQGIMMPAIDNAKGRGIYKLFTALTGSGTRVLVDSIMGSGILIRNAIGISGIIVILCISLIPIVKVAVYILMYRVSAALIQPVSDKRIVESIGGVYKGAELLMKVMMGTVIVLMISIVVVCCMTNQIIV